MKQRLDTIKNGDYARHLDPHDARSGISWQHPLLRLPLLLFGSVVILILGVPMLLWKLMEWTHSLVLFCIGGAVLIYAAQGWLRHGGWESLSLISIGSVLCGGVATYTFSKNK